MGANKMSTFKNEFSWSISRDRVFQTCPRQYYFNYYAYWGGWGQNAPERTKQIYLLKNLKNRHLWRGDHVHQCIKHIKYFVSYDDIRERSKLQISNEYLRHMGHGKNV